MFPFTKDCTIVSTKIKREFVDANFFLMRFSCLKIVRKFHFGYVAYDHSCGIGDKRDIFIRLYIYIY